MNAAFADRHFRRNVAGSGLSHRRAPSPPAAAPEVAALADALEDILRSEGALHAKFGRSGRSGRSDRVARVARVAPLARVG